MPKIVRWVDVQCFRCSKQLRRRETDMNKSKTGRVFCSRECLRATGAKPRLRPAKQCKSCGKEFYPSASAGQMYCSRDCKDNGGRKYAPRQCEFCGADFTYRAGSRKFCSRDCWTKAQYRRPLGRFHNGKPAVVDNNGYVRVFEPSHPKATRGGWVFEHRLVVEGIVGRYLDRDEEVHHINHVRHDNSPGNLQLMSAQEHRAITGFENGEALRSALAMRQKLLEYEKRFGPLPDAG